MAGEAFTAPVDICNRGLMRCGARRVATLADPTKNAKECNFVYDKLRRAELRRNVWTFSIRRAFLRPVGTSLQQWDPTKTYAINTLVSFGQSTSSGSSVNYISLANGNLNNEPDLTVGTSWAVYTASTSQKITFPAYVNATAYVQGNIVTGSDNRIYVCTKYAGSTGNDPTSTTGFWTEYFSTYIATQYDSTQAYGVGELVFYTTTTAVYYNTVNGNTNDPTTANSGWVVASGVTTEPVFILWPADTGPSTDPHTRNIYILPSGFIRRAAQAPEAGRTSWLGFPSNIPATDWVFEGKFLITIQTGALMLRFAADVIDVTLMDDLFCEGLGCRIGMEVCEPLNQSIAKIEEIEKQYKIFMGDARNINGIEQGSTEPPLDDFIQTRF